MNHSDPKIDRFNTIYKRHWKDLYHFASKRVNDHAVAEDLLHDVFLNFLKTEKYLEDDERIKSFLFASLRNRIIDYYRKNKLKLELEEEIPTWYSQHEHKSIELTLKREFEEFVDQQVMRFPEQMRRVVLLNAKEGLNHTEIAERLVISTKTVKNQLSLANQKLKIALQKFLK
ncbi:RNA polymerase sigma factor [Sphingobacterium sp. LRF_L2]|uniref:RNA polymerase sigma factor n=1 Tax=Sphingobacterium sp. LRF_L2 TaxID=3369421 RepID=UPI003F625A39